MARVEESFITMVERPNRGKKTKVWQVVAKEDGALLGEVRWFGRWRGYAFFAEDSTVFEQKCLRDIAAFVETKSKDHRKGWGRKKPPPTALERVMGGDE